MPATKPLSRYQRLLNDRESLIRKIDKKRDAKKPFFLEIGHLRGLTLELLKIESSKRRSAA